jgi:mono/diheme cytochrome c family protein
MGIGAAILAAAVLAVIAWLAYLVTQARVRRRREEPPQNLTPYLTDDELESNRLNRVLVSALVSTAVISITLPIYFLNETSRQVSAEHRFEEIAVERGHEWWLEYQCWRCHGDDGSGGGAPFVEPRSGIATTWVAPSLNDVLYRYTEEETRFWIVYGRQGTPMPAWGTEGGGPLNSQQVEELVAYIDSIQLSQEEVLAKTAGAVTREIPRIEGADEALAIAIAAQEDEIAALELIPQQHEAVAPLPGELRSVLTGTGTCTARSARLYATTCSAPGADTDRDGITDDAEAALNGLLERIIAAAPPSDPLRALEALEFDPANPFTTNRGSERIADLAEAQVMVTEFASIARDLRLTNDNLEALLTTALDGLAFLLEQADERPYAIEIAAIADAAFGGDTEVALRAAALYNAYCARCHTAGFSAGVPFTHQPGSGAFGPALLDGRAVIQFPDAEDHFDFVVRGSENAIGYGANGIGRGWMPGFGAMLTQADIDLIVAFERALP